MHLITLECTYCAHTWKKNVWGSELNYELTDRCPKCSDPNIKVLGKANTDVFGYEWKPKDLKKA